MPSMKCSLAAVMVAVSTLAAAHGDAAHGGKPAATRKEQQDWGIAGDARAVRRTIEVGMSDDVRFRPDHIEVRQGDTVRFVVRNRGRAMHEFVVGTKQALDEHAALMQKFPDMEHDEPYMAHVPPGRTGEIVWTFNRVGGFGFACLIAGHYQAGMVGRIEVVPPAARKP
ncbi:MAG: cupredoxin family protein [Burkholderiaceae bacterium]|nr:cupredoxin family protein [Burkholderiaceae bacterium]